MAENGSNRYSADPRNTPPVVLGSGRGGSSEHGQFLHLGPAGGDGGLDMASSPQAGFSAPPSTPPLAATRQFLHMTPGGGDGGLAMAASPYFSSPQSGFSAPPSTPLLAGQFLHMTPGGGDGGLDMAASPYFSSPQSGFSSPCPTLLGDLPRSDFTPHVLVVGIGEDVVTTIQSFWQNANKGVCILSASGDVSDVTLREPISGISTSHQGTFCILTLEWPILSSNNGSGLRVSLADNDCRVIGGTVRSLLAASPVQEPSAKLASRGEDVHDTRDMEQ